MHTDNSMPLKRGWPALKHCIWDYQCASVVESPYTNAR
jgi:hypothetical protein